MPSKYWLLIYSTFEGRTVRRAWRGKKPADVRYKAEGIADCDRVVSITEISEEQFARFSADQHKTKQTKTRNRRRYA